MGRSSTDVRAKIAAATHIQYQTVSGRRDRKDCLNTHELTLLQQAIATTILLPEEDGTEPMSRAPNFAVTTTFEYGSVKPVRTTDRAGKRALVLVSASV
ncbi:hypothetical protein NM688_g5538 [Phlebia brevispora]|uniref:Uncharacterized protein n=1 Tax=Phlebia brevispora TaxID=194682 RepID=A0ACC1STU2_9APHY|nr:hypothetical protein NM688_g5538 [Phlebia brevispora]